MCPFFSTGAAVAAVRVKDAVVMVADTLVSYGSMARYQDVSRVHILDGRIAIAFTGDHADFQEICEEMDKVVRENNENDDGIRVTADSVASHLRLWLYDRRCKMDPVCCFCVVADDSHLHYVDLYGTHYTDDIVCTGYGEDFALPLLRKKFDETPPSEMSVEDASKLLLDCERLLYARHCRASRRCTLAVLKKGEDAKCQVKEVEINWESPSLAQAE